LGQSEELFRQLLRCMVLRPLEIEYPQSKQAGKELGRLPSSLTQLSCSGISLFYFRGCIPLRGDQRYA
jgi:hypothetical protein